MSIVWKDNLATGINEIDNQHKELFDRINKLFQACHSGQGTKEVINVMSFLENYVIEHFSCEEKLQLKSNFPNYAEHKKQHEEFKAEITNLKQELSAGADSTSFVIKINNLIVNWLLNHIKKSDKELSQHIKTKV